MAKDKHLSKEFKAIEYLILDAHKNNAPLADIKELFNKMEQLANAGDKSAMSFIEKAKLSNSSDYIRQNTVWITGDIYHMKKVTVDDDLR